MLFGLYRYDGVVDDDYLTSIAFFFALIVYGAVQCVAPRFEEVFDQVLQPRNVFIEFLRTRPYDRVPFFRGLWVKFKAAGANDVELDFTAYADLACKPPACC